MSADRPMNRCEMLADLFAFNADWARRAVEPMPDALLRWTPDDEANSIAVTVWHVARMLDIFRTRFMGDGEQDNELWFAEGWAERTGYDPRGIGIQGMGGVIGYTPEEVRAIPDFERETLLAYFDAASQTMVEHLQQLPEDALEAPPQGTGSSQSIYGYARHILMDVTRHTGEILTLQMLWAREHDRSMVDAAP